MRRQRFPGNHFIQNLFLARFPTDRHPSRLIYHSLSCSLPASTNAAQAAYRWSCPTTSSAAYYVAFNACHGRFNFALSFLVPYMPLARRRAKHPRAGLVGLRHRRSRISANPSPCRASLAPCGVSRGTGFKWRPAQPPSRRPRNSARRRSRRRSSHRRTSFPRSSEPAGRNN